MVNIKDVTHNHGKIIDFLCLKLITGVSKMYTLTLRRRKGKYKKKALGITTLEQCSLFLFRKIGTGTSRRLTQQCVSLKRQVTERNGINKKCSSWRDNPGKVSFCLFRRIDKGVSKTYTAEVVGEW
jgi:hypothetical protein